MTHEFDEVGEQKCGEAVPPSTVETAHQGSAADFERPGGVPGPLRIGLAMFLFFPLGFRLLGQHPTLRHDKRWRRIGIAWAILGGWIVALYSGVLILCLLPVVRFLKRKYPDLNLDKWVPADVTGMMKRAERELAGPDGNMRPKWVGLAILACSPVGLYLLWRHPTLGRDRKWWGIGGAWSLVVLVMMARGDHGKRTTGDQQVVTVDSSTSHSLTAPTAGGKREARSNDASAVVSTVEPPAIIRTLLEAESFIAVPPGAIELPNEVLTSEYYPFLEGKIKVVMYSKDVAFDAENIMRVIYDIMPSHGKLNKTTQEIYKIVEGKIVGSVPRSELEKLEKADPPERYRLREEYIEVGMPSGSEISWSHKLKLGAKKGDSWEEASPIHQSRFFVKSIFMLDDRPCAVIVERTRIKLDKHEDNAEITTWYVKGKGAYRTENKIIEPSGNAKVVARGELIYFPK
ncbi:MAG: hypothetical protein JWN86_1337 [Planctomycetota bacterium]|nr:hypothetical protein [Planctomycetota bacterium]